MRAGAAAPPDGHGAAWATLGGHIEQIKAWLDDDGLTVVKIHNLLARQGVVVPERTLHRYCAELCGPAPWPRGTTVRVADGEPGVELPGRLRPDGPDLRPGDAAGAGCARR